MRFGHQTILTLALALASQFAAPPAHAQPCGQWLQGAPFEAVKAQDCLGLATEQTANGPILWAAISGTPGDEIRRYDGVGHWELDIPIQSPQITAVGVYNGKPVFGYTTASGAQRGVSIKTDVGGGWNTLISTALPSIRAFAQYGPDLYAVGVSAGGRGEVWRFNGSQWSMAAFGNAGSEFLAAAAYNNRLYVGGSFTAIQSSAGPGANATNLVRFDGTSWTAVPNSNLNGRVTLLFNHVFNSLVFFGSQLVISGNFTQCGSPPVSSVRIAAYADGDFPGDPARWAGFGGGISAPATSFTTRSNGVGGDLIAAGPFSVIGDNSLRGMIRWAAGAWQSTGVETTTGLPVFATNFGSLTAFGGGGCQFMLGARADKVMAYDGQRVHMLGSGTDEQVFDLATSPDGSTVFAAGMFTVIENTIASHIAAKPANNPDAPWVPLGTGTNGTTRCVFSDGPNVYVGGEFTRAGAVAANHIARWDGAAWHAMGPGGPDQYQSVTTILEYNGLVTAVGNPTNGNPGVAQWNGANWTFLGPPWPTSPVISDVDTACVHDGQLYLGGRLNLPGPGVCFAARFNGTAWEVFVVPDLPANCTSLASLNGSLYASTLNTVGSPMVHRFDGNAWVGLSNGIAPSKAVFALRAAGGLLYAAGLDNYFAVLENGATWRRLSVGSPPVTIFNDIEPVGPSGQLWLGSNHESPAPGISSWRLARFSNTPVIASQPQGSTTCPNPEGASFTITLDGVPFSTPTFEWRKNGAPIAPGSRIHGQDSATLHIFPTIASDSGVYDCLITNDCGTTASEPATLTVCAGDFNCSGTVTVQDLFDFLADYFAQDPAADVNASGDTTVQDIFDFLAALFTPCA